MALDDRLLPPSFRGIGFFLDSHEFTGGRHAIAHEIVDRDSPTSEDVGIKSKTFTIEGHLIGDAYFLNRNALISAMDDDEPGTLIHPYLGPKEVRPQSYAFREDNKEGRIGRFTLVFIEVGDPSFPFALLDKVTKFINTVFTVVAQVKNAFQLVYSVTQLPGFVIDSAEA